MWNRLPLLRLTVAPSQTLTLPQAPRHFSLDENRAASSRFRRQINRAVSNGRTARFFRKQFRSSKSSRAEDSPSVKREPSRLARLILDEFDRVKSSLLRLRAPIRGRPLRNQARRLRLDCRKCAEKRRRSSDRLRARPFRRGALRRVTTAGDKGALREAYRRLPRPTKAAVSEYFLRNPRITVASHISCDFIVGTPDTGTLCFQDRRADRRRSFLFFFSAGSPSGFGQI